MDSPHLNHTGRLEVRHAQPLFEGAPWMKTGKPTGKPLIFRGSPKQGTTVTTPMRFHCSRGPGIWSLTPGDFFAMAQGRLAGHCEVDHLRPLRIGQLEDVVLKTRSSSREVRIRAPTFSCSLFL